MLDVKTMFPKLFLKLWVLHSFNDLSSWNIKIIAQPQRRGTAVSGAASRRLNCAHLDGYPLTEEVCNIWSIIIVSLKIIQFVSEEAKSMGSERRHRERSLSRERSKRKERSVSREKRKRSRSREGESRRKRSHSREGGRRRRPSLEDRLERSSSRERRKKERRSSSKESRTNVRSFFFLWWPRFPKGNIFMFVNSSLSGPW